MQVCFITSFMSVLKVLGSGSLMDGISFGVPTVLVPNPSLLNNHQEELAQEAEKAGYCIRGDLR
jgi:beta-1,4-N-acetylglucosaminyltransferase